MTYTGPPTIFSLNELERGRGTQAPRSVCWSGGVVYYLGSDGFYRFTDHSEPISAERVSKWFFDKVDASSIPSVRGVVDRRNTVVIWSFKSDSTLAYSDNLIFYNWAANRWSWAEVNTEVVVDYLTTGVSLEDLDALITDIDSSSITLDSDAYKGGTISLAAFDTDHKLATFNGTPLAACLETGEFGELTRTIIRNVRPLVDGRNNVITVTSATRNRQDENETVGLPVSLNGIGEANFRANARYHRLKVDITGGFDHAAGVDVDAHTGGRR
jgi:hypothetical protein